MPKSHVYSDLDKSLAIDRSGNVTIHYDEAAIVQSIKALMATVNGERVRSGFGGSLVRLLFEPIGENAGQLIGYELKELIENYEPRVSINRISIEVDYDRNSYDITILLRISEINRTTRFTTRLRSLADL